MTRQELTDRLRRSRGMSDYENQTGDREAVAALDALYAEIDALRRLSVIATCDDCRWCHSTEVCTYERAYIEQEIDGSDKMPPEWCLLRNGGAR